MRVHGETLSEHNEAAQAVANSAVLVNATNLTYTFNRFDRFKFEFYCPFTLAGAVSGWQFNIVFSVAPAVYTGHLRVYNGITPGALVNSTVQAVAAAAVGGALAAAGNHIAVWDGFIDTGGNTPWTITFQFAQNVADPAAITLLNGCCLTIVRA